MARSSSDDSAVCYVLYCTSGFVDDVMFSHNGLCGIGSINVGTVLQQIVKIPNFCLTLSLYTLVSNCAPGVNLMSMIAIF